MKHNHFSQNELSSNGWQILGELELPVGFEASGRIGSWLAKTLLPLKLHAEFYDKVSKSVHEAIARLLHPSRAGVAFEHLHLLVFIPADSSLDRQNWGFFRIEKVASAATDESIPDHVIELFLYREEAPI